MLLFAMILLSLDAAAAQPLEGDWSGALEVGTARLRLVLHVTAGESGLTARLDSIDQGAMGLPVTSITRRDAVVSFELRSLAASYEGRLSKDGAEIAGEWRQGGVTLPLVFRRGPAALPRPQEPRRPLPYREEEVVVENKAAGVKLAATLTVPNGKGPYPAVILLTGSGAQDRNETIMGHRPFLVLADYLTRAGIAVLRADDRGVGGSTGNLGQSSYEDLAGDALAAAGYLRTRKEIHPKQIGLAGHSEGGAVGVLAASRGDDIAFLILLAAPGVTGERLLYEQSRMIARMPGGNERAAALNRKFQEAMFAAVKRGAAEKELREAIRTLAESLPGEDRKTAAAIAAAAEKQVPALLTPAFRSLLTFDPAAALASVKCPVLALYGELDTQVPASLNLPPLAAALEAAGNRDYSLVKLPALNHLFQTARSGLPTEYVSIEETFAPAAMNIISLWIQRHTR